jgi:hypothetical protein
VVGNTAVWFSGAGNVTGAFCGARDGNAPAGTFPLNVTAATSEPFCPNGWVPPPESGLPPVPPPDAGCGASLPCNMNGSAYVAGGVWLFNISADPLETTNVAAANPAVVAALTAKLQAWNATRVPQADSAIDPASNPALFGDVWTPWRGNPDPAACDPNNTTPAVVGQLAGRGGGGGDAGGAGRVPPPPAAERLGGGDHPAAGSGSGGMRGSSRHE